MADIVAWNGVCADAAPVNARLSATTSAETSIRRRAIERDREPVAMTIKVPPFVKQGASQNNVSAFRPTRPPTFRRDHKAALGAGAIGGPPAAHRVISPR